MTFPWFLYEISMTLFYFIFIFLKLILFYYYYMRELYFNLIKLILIVVFKF